MNGKKYTEHSKNIIRFCISRILFALAIAIVLLIAMVLGAQTHPEILFLGFVSFAIVMAVIGLIAAITAIGSHIKFRKRYPDFYSRANDSQLPFSRHIKLNTQINTLDDSDFRKIKRAGNFIGITLIILWLGFVLAIIVGGLYLRIHVVSEFLEMVNNYISPK